MKVFGELEQACLEQLASTGPSPATRGRIYADITDPAAAIPTFYDGTQWQQLAFVEPAQTIVSQNSGTTCTVDWSQSLIQEVVLTAHCVISFSNPQTDKEHTLIVRNPSSVAFYNRFSYALNMPTQDTDFMPYQRTISLANGEHDTLKWIYKSGLVPAISYDPYSDIRWPFVASIASIGVGIAPSEEMIALGCASTPFASFFPLRKKSKNSRAGTFGQRNDRAPTALAGSIKDISFHPNNPVAFFAGATTPFIQAFALDNTDLSITTLGNPSTLPTGAAQCCNVSPNGYALAVGHATSPFLSMYNLSLNINSAFTPNWGLKVTDPASLPVAQVNAVKFSPFGDYLAIASQTTPFLEVYQLDNSGSGTAFLGKSAPPGTLPAGGCAPDRGGDGLAWRPQGDYIAMAMSVTPYIYVIPFNRLTGLFGAPIAFTDTVIAATAGNVAVAWSPCGRYLYTAGTGGGLGVPFFAVYDFQNFTLGANIKTIAGAVATSISGMEVSADGNCAYLALTDTRCVMAVVLEQPQKDYLRIK